MTQAGETVAGAGSAAASTPETGKVVVSRDDNFVADLGLSTLLLTPDRALAIAPLTDGVRSAAGSAALSLLVTMADVAGSDPALANCRPDWTATQDLSLYAAGWLTEGPVVGDHRLVRLGKRVVVVSVDLYDGHGMDDFGEIEAELDVDGAAGTGRLTLAARGLVTFVRLPSTAADPPACGRLPPAELGR